MKISHLVVALTILLTGCSGEKGSEKSSQLRGFGKPLVFASNYPLHYFAERISTPLVDVRLTVTDDEDPAFWKPTVEDIQSMQRADLIVLNGASYESWLKNVSLPSSRLVFTSDGFKEQYIALKDATTHSHGLDGEHEHSATAFTTWLDLKLAIEQGRMIKDAFSTLWPEHKEQFESQFGTLAKEMETLDVEIEEIINFSPNILVLFSHPVYQYFARRYGLNGRSVHWEPNEMPSDSMLQELNTILLSHPSKWMIWEGEPLSDIKAKLDEIGINSVVLDPCANLPDDGDFTSVMKLNIVALKTIYKKQQNER